MNAIFRTGVKQYNRSINQSTVNPIRKKPGLFSRNFPVFLLIWDGWLFPLYGCCWCHPHLQNQWTTSSHHGYKTFCSNEGSRPFRRENNIEVVRKNCWSWKIFSFCQLVIGAKLSFLIQLNSSVSFQWEIIMKYWKYFSNNTRSCSTKLNFMYLRWI